MRTATIQVEAVVRFRKIIKMPEDDAMEFQNTDDETIICNVDSEDIEDITDHEVIDVHVAN